MVIRTSLGNIRVRLDREKAPRTTENFLVNYVERGWYANTIIHHVAPQNMIMGGAYLSGMKPKLTSAEIAERGILNEANNGLSNRRGTLAMNRLANYEHSATSEFFINLAENDHLDYAQTEDGRLNGYCVFGQVIEGLEIADKIASLPAKSQAGVEGGAQIPTETVVILAIEQVESR
ncbi:MAG: peptidylprolyl isomerase [Planctomycetota bacterium]|nr:peptidylprolyl isomerase [Planctomycetota bacterium]